MHLSSIEIVSTLSNPINEMFVSASELAFYSGWRILETPSTVATAAVDDSPPLICLAWLSLNLKATSACVRLQSEVFTARLFWVFWEDVHARPHSIATSENLNHLLLCKLAHFSCQFGEKSFWLLCSMVMYSDSMLPLIAWYCPLANFCTAYHSSFCSFASLIGLLGVW